MGLLQTDLPDQVKIWFVFRALPPPLQRQVALAPDGSPWATYDAFRQRATRIYMQTLPSYSQACMAPRGILSGANAAIIGQRPMGYLTTGSLGLPLTGEGQAGRPMKQARTQIGAGAASGSGAASSSSRPQVLGRRVDPSTSVHQGKPTFNPGLSENTARLAWLRSTGRCFHCYQRYTPNHQCPVLQGN